MSLFSALSVSASGMSAQRTRAELLGRSGLNDDQSDSCNHPQGDGARRLRHGANSVSTACFRPLHDDFPPGQYDDFQG